MKGKIFYQWFDAYYRALEDSYQVYYRSLKRRLFKALQLNRRKIILKAEQAKKFYKESIRSKAFYAFLRNLNIERTRKQEMA